MFLGFGHRQLDFDRLLSSMEFLDSQTRRLANRKRQILWRSNLAFAVAEQQIPRPYPRTVGRTTVMHILKHPAFTPVPSNGLHGCIDGVPSRDVSHSGMSEARMASFKLSHETLNFLLECLRVCGRENLVPTVFSERVPIHSIQGGIEVLGFHQAADFVENLRALFESQVHCCLIPTGVEASPTAMNAAQ
jgi:hypothetical protein